MGLFLSSLNSLANKILKKCLEREISGFERHECESERKEA
jgi:hypothetical protein